MREGWQPLFGQDSAAETHLRNQGVGTGDIFLFFGLFRRVEQSAHGWACVRALRPYSRHFLIGDLFSTLAQFQGAV